MSKWKASTALGSEISRGCSCQATSRQPWEDPALETGACSKGRAAINSSNSLPFALELEKEGPATEVGGTESVGSGKKEAQT